VVGHARLQFRIVARFCQDEYAVKHLVYYEMHRSMDEAIRREKRLKDWRRAWKVRLIETMNPEWCDLFDPETGEIAMGPADVARGSG